METLTIDDCAPLRVVRPATIPDLGAVVLAARAAREGVYPVGGRTNLDVGLPPAKPGLALDTTSLYSVIDYPARDMTITVEAGITIDALQCELAIEGQWLPVDVAAPEQATLGGAIALNQSGPRRYGFGTLRDYVIGISFVTDDGIEVKAGGRVVKNVAGYDLMKLHIGALGTLGVVTQVTLKVKPRPEVSAAIAIGCETTALRGVLDLIHSSNSRPVAVELLNAEAWRATGSPHQFSDPWVIAIGFEEKAETVKWQLATIRDEFVPAPVRDLVELPEPSRFWSAIAGLQRRPESRYVWKAGVLPSKLAEVVTTVPIYLPGPIHASALNGIIWFHAPEKFGPAEHDKLRWMEQRLAVAGAHHYVMRRCPTEYKRTLRVWGRPIDRDLMRAVKRALDPDYVFNPGRFLA